MSDVSVMSNSCGATNGGMGVPHRAKRILFQDAATFIRKLFYDPACALEYCTLCTRPGCVLHGAVVLCLCPLFCGKEHNLGRKPNEINELQKLAAYLLCLLF